MNYNASDFSGSIHTRLCTGELADLRDFTFDDNFSGFNVVDNPNVDNANVLVVFVGAQSRGSVKKLFAK